VALGGHYTERTNNFIEIMIVPPGWYERPVKAGAGPTTSLSLLQGSLRFESFAPSLPSVLMFRNLAPT